MGFVARLRRGTQIINLNASPFTISADFVPPNVAEAPQIAENRGSRARRTGETRTSQTLTIHVHAEGTTVGYIRNQVDIINAFLRRAGKYDDPTLFEWRPDNYVSAEVVWGQGGAYRGMEILWGEMVYGNQYGWWDRGRLVPDCGLNLLVGPSIEGARQLAAQAKGGISEDCIGTLNGNSRGVCIPDPDETNGNYFYNPIFASATWGDTWTAGAGATLLKNINPKYIPFGRISARLASTSSVTGTLTANINVGDTGDYMLSTYVIQENLGAIASANAVLYYNGAALTTTFQNKGNGLYRLSAPVVGVASAVTAGILVKSSNVIYTGGFQLEKRKYLTPLMCGDFLGHSWQGTPHGSRSLRNTAYLRLPVAGILDTYVSTLRIVWTPDRSSTAFLAGTANGYIFHSSASPSFRLYFDFSSDRWDFMGVNSDDPVSFAAETPIIFHVVCNNGTYSLYVNGAFVKSAGAPYYDPTSGYIYFGSDNTPAKYCGGTLGAETIGGALTTAEVLADYTNIAPIAAAGGNVDPILYSWTKDGDNITDYTFTGDGNYSNIAVIGGVPGSLPAKTEIKAVVAGMNNADVYIGNLDVDYNKFINPEFLTFEGSPSAITIDTSDTTIATLAIDDDEFLLLAGKRLAVLLRGDEDGANNISLRLGISPGGAYYNSKYAASTWIASSTNVSADLTPELGMVSDEELYRLIGITRAVSVRVQGRRPTGSATFNLYSAQIIPFPMIRLVNTSASGIAPTILYIDGRAYEVNSAALSYGYTVEGSKKEFALLPGKYNLLISSIGTEAVASDSGDTLTYSAIYVTPRWAIL